MTVIYSNLIAESITVARLNHGCVTVLKKSRFPQVMRSRRSIFAMRRPA